MNSLNIRFVDENGDAFSGLDIELFNHDTVLYATDFFGGSKATSNSTGYIAEELTVAYEIYNGSSTTEDVDTTLQYHYGVRGSVTYHRYRLINFNVFIISPSPNM